MSVTLINLFDVPAEHDAEAVHEIRDVRTIDK